MVDDWLLQDIKNKLRVTWDDEDDMIRKIGFRAIEYLNGKCNEELDYTVEGNPKALMLERCFYDFNNALSDFETNYKSELLALIADTAVKKFVLSE